MKKIVASLMIVLFVMMAIAPAASAVNEKGGFLGFIVGCCFGVRSGAAYNDGKDLHWREWGTLIPIFNWVVGIMNGLDAMNGHTTKDMAAQYGANYY
jgi:hypothetical protein